MAWTAVETASECARGHAPKEVSQLKRVLAEKVLEVDFFNGALQQV